MTTRSVAGSMLVEMDDLRSRLAEVEKERDEARQAVTEFIVEMDATMKGPSTRERGQRLAMLVSELQRTVLR